MQEAEKAAYQAMQVAAEQQAAGVPVAEAPVPPAATTAEASQDVAMDVDTVQHGSKRKAEDDVVAEESKKPRMSE